MIGQVSDPALSSLCILIALLLLSPHIIKHLFYAGGSGRPPAPLTKGDVLYGHFNSTVSTIHRILEKRSFLFLPCLNPLFYRGPGHYRQAWPGFEPEHRRFLAVTQNEGVTFFKIFGTFFPSLFSSAVKTR